MFLQPTKGGNLNLPVHYNRLIQGMIYQNISKELASFLHNQGYVNGGRSFKLFTFSRLLGKFILDREKKQINFPEGARLVISSPVKEFCTSLMGCMLGDGVINLGGLQVEITQMNVEKQQVEGDVMVVKTLSPITVYSTFVKPNGSKYTCYFQPGEQEFIRQLTENLRKKYASYYNCPALEGNVTVKVLNRPQQNITMYKQTVIKGYSCKLGLNGNQELLQLAVEAGIGAKNSQGFGCLEVV